MTFIGAVVFAWLLGLAAANVITMGLSQTSRIINATSNYTISMERTLDASGATITPSQLSTSAVVSIYMSGFNLSQASCPTNQSCSFSGSTVTINGVFSQNANLTSIQLLINNVVNPLYSNTQINVSAAISSGGTAVDQASTSTSFLPSAFLSASTVITPGNVTYNSNLTLTLVPSISLSAGSRLNVTIPRFWKNSQKNTSANIPAGVTCSVSCNLTSTISAFVITFNNLTGVSGATLTILLGGVVSPPTTESVDTLSMISYDSNGYQLDIGTAAIAATLPNYFGISLLQAGILNKPYTLILSFQTPNVFANNDTLTIVLPPETALTSASTASLSNSTVTSLVSQLIMPNTIQFINNTINFANPASMTITLTNLSGIASTKPTSKLGVTIYRNNFAFNYGSSSIVAASDVLSFTISTTSVMAAASAIYTLTVSLSNSITASGSLVVSFPDLIILKNCSSAASTNTTCSINNAKVSFTLLSALTQTTAVVMVGVRNPVNSVGMSLGISTYDSQGYLMDSGTTAMFAVQQASLPSSTIVCSLSSNVVYDIANYTFTVDLTGYQLSDGFGIITLPASLQFVNIANAQCAVNSQPNCILNSTAIKFPIIESVQTYVIVAGQLRNPQSALPFTFSLVVTDTAGNTYYSTISAYYSANLPFTVPFSQTNTNCTNEAAANYSLTFIIPTGFVTIGSVFKAFVEGVQLQTVTNLFSNPLVISLTNQPSLKPWELAVQVTTSDGYDMFNSSSTVVNCQASNLNVAGQVSGLPEDNTVVSISAQSTNGADTLVVNLPAEYSTTGMSCVPISNLTCTILTNQSLKVVPQTASSALNFQLTNITNPLSSGYFSFQTYISGYLSSSNNNTLKYQAPCQFPCRSCLSNNTSACAGCLKTLSTAYPILDNLNNKCVTSCPSGYYNSGNVCIACPVECSTCISSLNCTVCAGNFNLFQGKCLTDCPDLYYPSSGVCQACTSPCSTCASASACKSCASGYNLYGTQCLQQCPNTTIASNQICLSCSSPCQTCSTTTSVCTSCYTGSYLHNSTCLTACPSGYVPIGGVCQPCLGCLTCINNQSGCTSCFAPTLLYNFTCRSDCPTGYYGLSTDSSCIKCPAECSSCFSSTNCSSCVSPYNLQGTSCVSNCPASTMPYQLQCVSCITGCSKCSTLSTCENCSSNYLFYHSVCVASCPSHAYLANNTCLDCPSECATCNPLCQSCISGYLLYNGTCLLSCPSSTTTNGSNCKDCSSLFSYCASCTTLACLTCLPSFLFYNGACLTNCPTNTISVNGTCVACRTGCVACVGSIDNCSSCQSGYLYYALTNSCVLSCPYPTISNAAGTSCISCNPQCASCTSLTNCTSCAAGYSLYNSACLLSCPTGMYNLSGTCQNCSTGCQVCNSSTCQQCQPSFYFANGACYSVCPSDLPYAYNATCNKCSQNCTSCTSSLCAVCVAPLYIYGVNCVAACPQNTTLQDNVRCAAAKNDSNNTNNNNGTSPVNPVSTTGFQFVPFTALLVVALLIVVISKVQYSTTYLFGGMSALTGVICVVSWIVVVALNIAAGSIGVSLYCMLAAFAVHLVLDVFFLVKNTLMLRSDEAYQAWKQKRIVNKVCSIITSSVSVLSFKIYLLQFSQLFGTYCLRARLDSLSKFSLYDTVMMLDLLSSILAIASSAAGIYFNVEAKSTLFFLCVDCLVVSLVDLLLGLATKKRKGIFDEPIGSESDIEQIEAGSKDGKGSMTMQKLLSEIHEQPSVMHLKDEEGNAEAGGHRNKVAQDGQESDTAIIADANAIKVTGRNVFDQNSEKVSESDEFKVKDEQGQQCLPENTPIDPRANNDGKQTESPDTNELNNSKVQNESSLSGSQYSQRAPIQLGIEKYIDMTLQGRKNEEDGITTSNELQTREQNATEKTVNADAVEGEPQKEADAGNFEQQQGYLTEQMEANVEEKINQFQGKQTSEHQQAHLDPLNTSNRAQKVQADQQESPPPCAEIVEAAPRSPQKSNNSSVNKKQQLKELSPKLKSSPRLRNSSSSYGKQARNSIEQPVEAPQIPVPAYIEESINNADIEGPVVYQDTVLSSLISPNRSSTLLKDSSERPLNYASGSKLRKSIRDSSKLQSKQVSLVNSNANEHPNLNAFEENHLEQVESHSETHSNGQVNNGRSSEVFRAEQRRHLRGVQHNEDKSHPGKHEQHEEGQQINEQTDQVNELTCSNDRQSRYRLSRSQQRSTKFKRSAASLEPPPKHEPNYIPDKAYLKESPRLAPFKFKNSKKRIPPANHRTLQVQRQDSDFSSEKEEHEFEPAVIDLYHQNIPNRNDDEPVPKQTLPVSKSRPLISGQTSRTSPPRRLFSSKPRSHEKSKQSLTSRDNVQLMLQRLQASHKKDQKMRQLEEVYLRSLKP